jgi:OOP family OmpA-OmpF porin
LLRPHRRLPQLLNRSLLRSHLHHHLRPKQRLRPKSPTIINSAVLKTASYPILDKVAVELKKDPSARFMISGHSSAEGTAEHNMSLSLDRANSVKQYLDNAGAFGDNIQVKGYGESVPLTENKTEEGRALNRRVEIKLLP